MTDDRIDFSELDPTRDARRFEAILSSIAGAAAPRLAARRRQESVFGQVVSMWRPLLAAAAVIVIVSSVIVSRTGSTAPASEEVGLVETLGVPQSVAEWVRGDELPSTTELLVALEVER